MGKHICNRFGVHYNVMKEEEALLSWERERGGEILRLPEKSLSKINVVGRRNLLCAGVR